MKTVTFKKGKTYHRDDIYPYYRLFGYNVDDDGCADDEGFLVYFTLTVQLKYKVIITN